jgi:hypothetical protein
MADEGIDKLPPVSPEHLPVLVSDRHEGVRGEALTVQIGSTIGIREPLPRCAQARESGPIVASAGDESFQRSPPEPAMSTRCAVDLDAAFVRPSAERIRVYPNDLAGRPEREPLVMTPYVRRLRRQDSSPH